MNEQQFRENLTALTNLAKKQQLCVSDEQVAEYFPDTIENEQQKKLLLDYLTSQKISVGEKADLDELLSMEDKDYLAEYEESLAAIGEIARDELEEIMMSAVAGDGDAQQIVLSQFLSQAAQLAKLYAGQGIFIEDLIGEGNLALTQAVRDLGYLEVGDDIFDEVSGFLGKAMMDSMELLINEEAEEKNADQKMADKVNRVADVAQELYDELRRKVSPEEICAGSELTLDEVAEAMRISGNQIDTIEMEMTNDDNGK